MNTTSSIRTALMVLVAIGFGIARAGSVHAPTRENSALHEIDPRDIPIDRYLDLGRSWAALDSDEYQAAPSPWQCERHDLADVMEEGRYVDLGAQQFVRAATFAAAGDLLPSR